MNKEKQERLQKLEVLRKTFGIEIQRFEKDFGVNSYLNRAPRIVDDSKLEGAVLLSDRYQLLERLPRRGIVAEIGVDQGHFSKSIIEICYPDELFLIDIDLSRLHPENEELLRASKCVRLIEGRSETSISNINKTFTWIYIDGDHSYEQVKRDIIESHEKIVQGGYLVFNDYTLWSPANMMNYGVSRAVNEFLNSTTNWELAYFAFQGGGYHDLALRRRA
ncbi:MAG: class I SAM-dependent methyltransferase [Rhizobiaceae bacterium]|jgi:hypothetical protein|nr:class I SAM-dependent methyltransferase [Rhizobiaceae bacterium]